MADYDYDLVVIGTGPAGEAAAINAAKLGRKVAVVEMREQVGGGCAHKGTIPSKALRHSVKQIVEFNTNPLFRVIGEPKNFSFPQVLKTASEVIAKQVMLRTQFYARNRVDVFFGFARFVDRNNIEILGNETNENLRFDQAVIATGSSPYEPSDIDFSHERICTSDTVLNLKHTPRTLIIYGAGVIGCEYASIFAGLDVKVDLVDNRANLLEFLDVEISDSLSYHLRNNGVRIRHNETYKSVSANDTSVTIEMESGKRLCADMLLFCNGRSGNTKGVGLENLGIETNSRGQLEIDQRYQTTVDGIYAAGDVVGWPSLASAAYDQGRSAASDLLGLPGVRFVDDVPTGIYTIPEISSLGKTEEQLTAEKVPYEVGQAFFKDLARAQISGEVVGMLKILFNRDTYEILGIHCFGDRASEIIHIGQAIMNQKGDANTIEYFVNNTFNFPTMAEAYRVAAQLGINRARQITN
ncbi:Si-specific NAD(P)(+) transhydrogenase [Oceanospirillaceae bacterium]|jgi:NAD(P) transhydrogenase|nr:Si-specific NAD(P)(+) transhydrogenase [Oceanospirillaceae bacterium]MDB9972576.1 Si-specific NAD(P)(+) transhydrogenase [Oceanospirillaceae bacterium]MDC1341630.1 Si-specific NAD(P)(+) transhydrogenase [Oceanospirillaceae bacterium]MDC1509325.1 Si-specific NAD(P)(+) transhydrogenase [Oceanospirillaceae bacterium]|tara:strand:- start:1490 stop:2893 length:1404 start_codon:yes stop_codon:yes gene_type:complete